MTPSKSRSREWSRDGFFISTDTSMIPRQTLNQALDSDHVPWARALAQSDLETMLANSVNFGIYTPTGSLPPVTEPDTIALDPLVGSQDPSDTLLEVAEKVHKSTSQLTEPNSSDLSPQSSEQPCLIGFARLVTDLITMAYLCDVYIDPAWEKLGLGSWLIQCVREWLDDIPTMARVMLICRGDLKEQFYSKVLGTHRLEDENTGARIVVTKGKGCEI